MGIFLFQEIDFTGGVVVVVYEWDAFNPYHRYPDLGTSSEVLRATPLLS